MVVGSRGGGRAGVEQASAAFDGFAAAVGGNTFPVAGVEGEVKGEGRAISRGDDLWGGVERKTLEDQPPNSYVRL